jgi:hypothetical protein
MREGKAALRPHVCHDGWLQDGRPSAKGLPKWMSRRAPHVVVGWLGQPPVTTASVGAAWGEKSASAQPRAAKTEVDVGYFMA